MKKIKIRTKMMLWYAVLTTILLAIFLPILFHALANSLMRGEYNKLELAASKIILNIELDEDVKVSPVMPAIIWNKNKIIYSNTNLKWVEKLYYTNDGIIEVDIDNEEWLVCDKIIDGAIKLRVCASLEEMEATLRQTLFIILAFLPVYFFVTIFGGLIIAKRALMPINKISDLAKNITLGDLSRRIDNINSADEVGELAGTFNAMLEALEQSYEKEKRFASDASHELRTPVSVIMANAEAILAINHTNDNINNHENAAAILAESKRMNIIIAQLLMLTRGVEGKYKPNFEKTNLNIIIGAVLEQLQDEAERQNITLIDEVNAKGDDIIITADQSLITQAVINLVSNAIKYGKSGGHVWVRADEHALKVIDDGIGIEKVDLPHVFERFWRADKSRNRGGSGLGLSIVKWVAEEHGGSVEVTSEVGKGSKFCLNLFDNSGIYHVGDGLARPAGLIHVNIS